MKNALTESQILLIERWFDGDATGGEAREATTLVASSVSAREFHEALKEIRLATEVAEGEAWSKATPPAAATILATCEAAPNSPSLSLSELAPMLERFFDGESDDLEAELIASMIDTREDVAEYIASLDELRGGVVASLKELDDRVPMNGFWDSIEARLEDDSFRVEEHAILVQRFHDNSVTDAERAQVQRWNSKHVAESLEALQELNLAVNAAMDEATEGVDFSSIWGAVESVMDADLESKGDNIVALGRVKRDQAERRSGFSKQSLGAIAAILAAVLIGGLISQQFLGPDQVIVERTIVIVDSVEYAAGASVMVDTPFRQASAVLNADSESEEPTVIWILDEGDGMLEEPADEIAPANGEEKKEKKPVGQPI